MLGKLQLTLLFIFLAFSTAVFAQPNKQYFWKGTSGNFNDPTKWWVDSYNSGNTATQAPNSTNSVFFMAAAFNTAGITVNLNANSNCDSLIWDNTISLGNTPIIQGASGVSLDIYGSFALAENLDFDFDGSLRFRSQRTGIETIDARGKMLTILKMDFDGAAATEFRLLSALHVEDLNNILSNLSPNEGGVAELLGGTLNTNGQEVSFDFFHSKNGNADRGLILNNSTIRIDGRHAEYCWRLDFDSLTNNYATFDATGSHLIFEWYYGYNFVGLGRGLEYDSISMNSNPALPQNNNGVYSYLNQNLSYNSVVEHLFVNMRLYLHYENTQWITFKNLYFDDKRGGFGWHNHSSPHVRLENVFAPNHCDHFYPIASISDNIRRMTIQKLTPGVLTLNNVLLTNVDVDITGGRSYIANNSIDANGNDPNWTINPPTPSRQLYFRDAVSNKWHELGNWEEKVGALFIPAACLPTPVDDVFFDGNSYTSNTIAQMDSAGYCRDITFENTIVAGRQFRLGDRLNIFGDFTGTSTCQIRDIGGGVMFYIGIGKTIQTNDAEMNINSELESESDYTIVGNYNGLKTRGISARDRTSILRTNSDTLILAYLYVGQVFMDSTQIYLHRNDRWSMYDRGGLKTYTGTTTVHFQPTTFSAISMRSLPNVIFYGDAYTIYYDTDIQGDITLLGDGNFSYSHYSSLTARSRVDVSGSMALYNGNMNLTAGKTYTFSSAVNSYVNIAGNLNAVGNCSEQIILQTTGYATGIIPFAVQGSNNIEYASISGLDNSANATITATNSIDAGDNTNFNFTTGTGSTFYWRALSSNATDFEGNWNDQGHWTTNPANLVGDSACVPGVLDSVIFDALSYSASSNGCTVSSSVYCRSLIFRADARLIGTGSTSGNIAFSISQIYIDESLMMDLTLTQFDYRGDIIMMGSGDLQTNGTVLEVFKLEFDNPTGVWNLQGDLEFDNDWAGTNITFRRYGIFSLLSGTVNTNNHNLTLAAQFSSTTTTARTLNLGSSTITHKCNGTYYQHWNNTTRYPWDIRTATNFTLNAGTSEMIFLNNTNTNRVDDKIFYMGDGLAYNKIRFEDQDEPAHLYRNANYSYAEFLGTTYLYDNNTFDSLRLEGGQYYYFGANKTQTLNAPHGKLISNGNSSSFVFIESTISGTPAFLRKPYGYAFCIDFVKVKEIEGTKETNLAAVPTAPIDFQAIHPFLEFQTGVNSDNINGSATGIWAFNLPPLVSPAMTNLDSIYLCKYGTPQYVPLTITGSSPYFIDYTWTDINSNTGANTVTVSDDDNDPATPFLYQMLMPTTATEIAFNINLQTSRCGELTASTPETIRAFSPKKDTLVDFVTTATCDLNNEPNWYTFMDDVAGEPVVAFLDKVNASDNQALGNMVVDVFFDPTVQTVNYMSTNYPYLQRHWDMTPTNNSAAGIRLFFTQTELDALAAQTFWGTNPTNPIPGTINPTTDIEVWKYASGTIGVGPHVVVPHTVQTMSGGITAPFDDITDVIAIEVEVASFSHFIIVPTQPVLLTLDLNNFEAKAINDNQVQIDWAAANEADAAYYEIQRSQDAVTAQTIETVQALGLATAEYQLFDNDPHRGVSYYRVKAVDLDGSATYSDWKAVEIEGWNVVRVYPVPTNEVLNIELNANVDDQVSLVVYDALGMQVYQSTQTIQPSNRQRLQVATSQLATGIYYLRISNDAGYTQQRKFVVE